LEIGWRGYVEIMEIYDVKDDITARARRLDDEIRKDNTARGRALIAETKRNDEKK